MTSDLQTAILARNAARRVRSVRSLDTRGRELTEATAALKRFEQAEAHSENFSDADLKKKLSKQRIEKRCRKARTSAGDTLAASEGELKRTEDEDAKDSKDKLAAMRRRPQDEDRP